jgi:hypothetical protein
MVKLELPCYGIVVTIAKDGGGSVTSDLHDSEDTWYPCYDPAINALESLILAHACAGIPVDSPAYVEGIETAVDAILNNYA